MSLIFDACPLSREQKPNFATVIYRKLGWPLAETFIDVHDRVVNTGEYLSQSASNYVIWDYLTRSANLRRKMAKELWLDAILMHKSMVPAFKVDVDI
ncbi:hypothetical protein V9K92_15570 [Phyllobacterium sp. CCNWLW109]|uniref:hypothetical protein n=1 Tax=Phyllobacterium sp. CCNWLW109 TaxID=3127479 RepID=UPI003077B314